MNDSGLLLLYERLLQAVCGVVDRAALLERMPDAAAKLHVKTVAFYGSAGALEKTKRFVAQLLVAEAGTAVGALGIGLASGDWSSALAAGGVVALLLPFVFVRELDSKIKRKRRSMLLELPEFLNKLTLLVGAGETVQQAIRRCVAHKCRRETLSNNDGNTDAPLSPLYRELYALSLALDNRQPLPLALEELCKRCGMAEISVFATTVLLNYRRGGNDFVYALGELSRTMWEKRKALTRTMGEEASAKLVFPMVVIFVVVMIVVAAPAVLLMNRN